MNQDQSIFSSLDLTAPPTEGYMHKCWLVVNKGIGTTFWEVRDHNGKRLVWAVTKAVLIEKAKGLGVEILNETPVLKMFHGGN